MQLGIFLAVIRDFIPRMGVHNHQHAEFENMNDLIGQRMHTVEK